MLMNLNDCILNNISKLVKNDRNMKRDISARPKLIFRCIDTHVQEQTDALISFGQKYLKKLENHFLLFMESESQKYWICW